MIFKKKQHFAAALCACALLMPLHALAAEIDPDVQAEFDRLVSIGAGDILDQYLSSLPEDVRNALVEAEEAKYSTTAPEGSDAQTASEDSCGVGLSWTLGEDGVLTITGDGEIFDFPAAHPAPWYAARESITSVVLGDGVAAIGNLAFADCVNLAEVTFPESLSSIGNGAFQNCAALTQVKLPGSLESIGWEAFSGCESLSWIQVPGTVRFIGGYAFAGCTKLETFAIPESAAAVEMGTFQGCTQLVDVQFSQNVTFIGSNAFSGDRKSVV